MNRRDFIRSGVAAGGVVTCPALGRAAVQSPRWDGIIDSHVHVWSGDYRRFPFAPGFTPEDLWMPSFTPEKILEQGQPLGVTRLNLVQMTWYGLDHSYIIDAIARNPGVLVGTGIVSAVSDVSGPSPDNAMIALSKHGIVAFRIRGRAARPSLLGDGPRWLEYPGYEKMFRCADQYNLPLSFLMMPEDIPDLDRMCTRFPGTPVIIDHLCGIGARGVFLEKEIAALCWLARHPRVMVKVGAFYARGARRPPYDDSLPLVRRVVQAFGPDRCMWESDAPLTRPGAPETIPPHSYKASLAVIRDYSDFLSPSDKEKILTKTAARLFFNR